jgi:hypothetical protein
MRALAPEDAVHPAFDAEPVGPAKELGADPNLGFIGGVGPGPLLLHAAMDLAAFRRRAAVARVAFDAPGPGHGQRKIAYCERDGLKVSGHEECYILSAARGREKLFEEYEKAMAWEGRKEK